MIPGIPEEEPMSHEEDKKDLELLNEAHRRGFLTTEKLSEAIRARLDQAIQEPRPPIAELLVGKGFLTREQFNQLQPEGRGGAGSGQPESKPPFAEEPDPSPIKSAAPPTDVKSVPAPPSSPGEVKPAPAATVAPPGDTRDAPASPPPAAKPAEGKAGPEIFPDIELVERIAATPLASVFKARRKGTDLWISLKVLTQEARNRSEIVESFLNAAKEGRRFAHPNIVPVLDAGQSGSSVYRASEWVEGETLRDLVTRRGPLPEKEAIRIFRELCDAVSYIHRQGFIHGNLHPENILIDKAGHARVTDHGRVRPVLSPSQWESSPDPLAARVHYAPPELMRQEELTFRSDVYSLGAVLFFMVTGGTVFTGRDGAQLARKYLQEQMPSAREIVDTVSEKTSALLRRMLRRTPEKRHGSIREVLEDLDRKEEPAAAVKELKAGLSVPAAEKDEVPPAKPTRRETAPPEPVTARREAPATTDWAQLLPKILWPVAVVVLGIFLISRLSKGEPVPGNGGQAQVTTTTGAPRAGNPAEVEAAVLFGRAEAEFGHEAFDQALVLYTKLQQEMSATDFCKERALVIADRIRVCQDKTAPKPPNEFQEDLARAQRTFDEGDFRRAMEDTLEVMQRVPNSEKEVRGELEKLHEAARKEVGADEAFIELQRLRGEGKWEKLEEGAAAYAERHGETRTGRKLEPHIRSMLEEARKARAEAELAAKVEEALRKVREAHAGRRWDEVIRLAEEVRKAHPAHPRVTAAAEELDRLVREANEKRSAASTEEQAQRLWEEAKRLAEEKKWEEALAAFDRLLGEYKETEVVKQGQEEIAANRADTVARVAEIRKTEAQKKLVEGRRLFDRQEWEQALEIFRELETKYADSIPDRMVDVRAWMDKCSRMVAAERALRIDDGEKGVAHWKKGGAEKQIEIDESDDAHDGAKAIRVTFKKHSEPMGMDTPGTWPRVEVDVSASLPEDASAISFWAKAEGSKPVRVSIELRLFKEKEDQVVFAVQRRVEPGKWTLFKIALPEFKVVWKHPKRAGPMAKFAFYNLQTVGISGATPQTEGAVLFDTIRFEPR